MNGYDYPPSQPILAYGPLHEGSHFFAEGEIKFATGTFKCEFEVAYTHECRIIVVCYLPQPSLVKALYHEPSANGIEILRKRQYVDCQSIVGQDARNGYSIEIHTPIVLQEGYLDVPTILEGKSYQVQVTHEGRASVSGGSSYYKYELIGASYLGRKNETYNLSPNVQADLRNTADSHSRNLGNQPVAELILPDLEISPGWTARDSASVFCALLSLAAGSDIRWTSESFYQEQEKLSLTYWEGRRNVHSGRITLPLMEDIRFSRTSGEIGRFIAKSFSHITSGKITLVAAQDYTRAIQHFMEYRLITRRAEDQVRLIGTSVEELLTAWESHMKHTPLSPITEDVAKQLLSVALNELDRIHRESIEGDSEEEQEQNYQRTKGRISTFFSEEILRPGFHKRLTSFFLHYSEKKPLSGSMKSRIDTFVKSRDSIVHTGKFSSNQKNDWEPPYYNVIMIFALMMFRILGYDGEYVDYYQRRKDLSEQHP
ncbi:MAG: hypothetical protein IAE83_22040 [Anaerolinea sp.]|nr:hypothetical protein [Anaerolinea sp.]